MLLHNFICDAVFKKQNPNRQINIIVYCSEILKQYSDVHLSLCN